MTWHAHIASHWGVGETIHADAIVKETGAVILLTAATVAVDGRISCVASPLADTTIESILKFNPDAWVSFTVTERLELTGQRCVLAGEGAMGNEGFVALEHDGLLKWVLFCTKSNPFSDLEEQGSSVLATDGYGDVWTIPMASPEMFTIERTAL